MCRTCVLRLIKAVLLRLFLLFHSPIFDVQMNRPFGVLRARRTRRRHKVNQSTQTQEAESTPPPSSEPSETWTCRRPSRYLNKGGPQDIWEKCDQVVEKHDEDMCGDLKDEITFLMVVAGLFLAIVTAFTIESYKLLQEDKQDTMSDLLVTVVRLLNDTSAQGHAQLPQRFIPDHRNIVVNQLWFLSSILSLVAVLIGTFCLQWISAFLRGKDLRDKSLSPTEVLGMRRLRHGGFIGWGVHHAPEALLLIVQLSIALFTAGLVYFLWNINRAAAIPALVVASITGILLYIVNVMPFLQSLIGVVFPKFLTYQCPYKSPASWLVRILFDSIAWTLSSFGKRWRGYHSVVGRLADWLQYRPAPSSDYMWKAHDISFAALQHVWNIYPKPRSIGSGLSDALNILVLESDAVDIIRNSTESLYSTFRMAENLYHVFGQDLSSRMQVVFNGIHTNFTLNSGLDAERAGVYCSRLLKDFTHALFLQNIASRSAKLHRIFLQHRFELYIRIKNSVLDLFVPELAREFGLYLKSPLSHLQEVAFLDLETKFQFLTYMNHSRHSLFIQDVVDYHIATEIIMYEGIKCPESAQCAVCLRSPGHSTDGMNRGNLSGVQHMFPDRGEAGVLSSSDTRINEDREEDPQYWAFRRLCFQVKEWLLGLPKPFGPVDVENIQDALLRSHPVCDFVGDSHESHISRS